MRAPEEVGQMSTGTGSEREARSIQGAVAIAGANGTPRPSQAVKRRHRVMMLFLAASLLRDRRFRDGAILGAITLAALARIARDGEVHARTRLVAWWDEVPVAPRVPLDDVPGGKPRATSSR
jgi:hypothetical protein